MRARVATLRRAPAVLSVLQAVWLTSCVSSGARLAIDRDWIEARSESFTLTSCLDEQATRELAVGLERFRAAALRLAHLEEGGASGRTHVIVFDRRSSIRVIAPKADLPSYFVPTVRGNHAALVYTRHVEPDLALKHEYTRFLLRERASRVHPSWYEEGLALYMSVLTLEDGRITAGLEPDFPFDSHPYQPWMRMRRVIAHDPDAEWNEVRAMAFYEESWALVHYLHRDPEHRAVFADAMDRYIALVEGGATDNEAFEQAFGMDMVELESTIARYRRVGRFETYAIPDESLPYSREVAIRPLSPAEAATRLGEDALLRGNEKPARTYLAFALEQDPELARAHAGLGNLYTYVEGDLERAAPHYARAVELDPADPRNLLDEGGFRVQQALAAQDPSRRREDLAGARERFLAAMKLEPDAPEPYYAYGRTFLVEGEDPADGIGPLERALSLAPGDIDIGFALAQAYLMLGRPAEAREQLRRVDAWTGSAEQRERATALLATIDAAAAAPEPAAEP